MLVYIVLVMKIGTGGQDARENFVKFCRHRSLLVTTGPDVRIGNVSLFLDSMSMRMADGNIFLPFSFTIFRFFFFFQYPQLLHAVQELAGFRICNPGMEYHSIKRIYIFRKKKRNWMGIKYIYRCVLKSLRMVRLCGIWQYGLFSICYCNLGHYLLAFLDLGKKRRDLNLIHKHKALYV